MNTPLLDAWELGERLKLPAHWILREAKEGRIPRLKVGRKTRFNPEAVEKALAERAASEHADAPSPSRAQG